MTCTKTTGVSSAPAKSVGFLASVVSLFGLLSIQRKRAKPVSSGAIASGHAAITSPQLKPDLTQEALMGLFLRRGLMIHNRDRTKARAFAEATMRLSREVYSDA